MLPTNYPRPCPSPGCRGPTCCLCWESYTSVGVGRINRSPSSCMLYVRSTHPHPGQRPVVDAVPETNRRPGGQGPAHTHTLSLQPSSAQGMGSSSANTTCHPLFPGYSPSAPLLPRPRVGTLLKGGVAWPICTHCTRSYNRVRGLSCPKDPVVGLCLDGEGAKQGGKPTWTRGASNNTR